MKSVGLFEAKTKLSQICRGVALSGQSVVVTHRGKPLVRIEKVESTPKRASVWDRRAAHINRHGPLTSNFDLPKPARQTWRDPLA
jgi:antitoxin (DNA-binding transcriptional repressor) of toxin-antitoxin stability system